MLKAQKERRWRSLQGPRNLGGRGGGGGGKGATAYLVLARPKSQILRSQLALSRRLLGLRSRWRTLAEWMYFSPRRI